MAKTRPNSFVDQPQPNPDKLTVIAKPEAYDESNAHLKPEQYPIPSQTALLIKGWMLPQHNLKVVGQSRTIVNLIPGELGLIAVLMTPDGRTTHQYVKYLYIYEEDAKAVGWPDIDGATVKSATTSHDHIHYIRRVS